MQEQTTSVSIYSEYKQMEKIPWWHFFKCKYTKWSEPKKQLFNFEGTGKIVNGYIQSRTCIHCGKYQERNII